MGESSLERLTRHTRLEVKKPRGLIHSVRIFALVIEPTLSDRNISRAGVGISGSDPILAPFWDKIAHTRLVLQSITSISHFPFPFGSTLVRHGIEYPFKPVSAQCHRVLFPVGGADTFVLARLSRGSLIGVVFLSTPPSLDACAVENAGPKSDEILRRGCFRSFFQSS